MATEPSRPSDDVVVEKDVVEKKDEEVLEREGVEQELMQKDLSEVGEELEDVQETTTGE